MPACTALLRAVATLRDLHTGLLRKLPADAPFAFVRQCWRRRIGGAPIDRQIYAFCVYVELRDRLRAGDVWVEGSRRYRSVEDQLIPRALFAALQAANPLPIPAPRSAAAWLADRRALLDRRLADVGRKAELHALEDVLLADGRMRITPLKAVTPVDTEAALAPLYACLPSIRITDLLSEVDRWTGFTAAFTHLHSGRAAEDPRVTLAAVLADATNLGHRRMAEACALVSQRQLAWLAAWHLREETYGRALGVLVDAQHRLPLAARFGAGSSSSSDGQHFPLGRRAQATGVINPHKGSEAAVSFYTHVSDRYAPFHSKVISATAGEAAHVLDGLLHHPADLAIEEHHVDGGGVSDHVFALCHLLGFRFAPRIPNIGRRRLHLFPRQDPGAALGPFVAGRIDADLIESHWPDLLRLAVSIRTGVVSASLMLERLGAYPRANGLALALREVGRVERTLFTFDWIESPEQRRRATRELNKGEAENALKRAIFFHRVGRIRDQGLQAQSHRASAVNLVACAIVLWNTTYLQAAIERLSAAGRPVPDEHLAHLSPLGWRHIIELNTILTLCTCKRIYEMFIVGTSLQRQSGPGPATSLSCPKQRPSGSRPNWLLDRSDHQAARGSSIIFGQRNHALVGQRRARALGTGKVVSVVQAQGVPHGAIVVSGCLRSPPPSTGASRSLTDSVRTSRSLPARSSMLHF